MKSWMVLILIILLIIVSGLAGYFLHRPETVLQHDPVIIVKPDKKLLCKIDSFAIVDKRQRIAIDSLKFQLTLLKKKHENISSTFDTLPAPELFREIARYYNDR